ncbi:MAG: hypothetical protein K2Z81_09985 [Cyanobacteria bacterium]|nr:hypothetical protein [Cyanobacteriota bacterium]
MKPFISLAFLLALLFGLCYVTQTQVETVSESTLASNPFNVVIDVDNPPGTVFAMYGGTITLVKQGAGGSRTVQVYTIPTDGRGELFLRMPGGSSGTVATLRPTRRGNGVIQIRQSNPGPGGRTFYSINVIVN